MPAELTQSPPLLSASAFSQKLGLVLQSLTLGGADFAVDILSLLLLVGLAAFACFLYSRVVQRAWRARRYDELGANNGAAGSSIELGSVSQAADPAQLLDNQRHIIAQLGDLATEVRGLRALQAGQAARATTIETETGEKC